jgi:uncharacterized coiled-coil DUF342 family protein
MNKDRRKAVDELRGQIETIKFGIEELQNQEQDYYDNMPEGIQCGEKGDKAQEAIDALESAVASMDEVVEYLESAQG